MSNNKSTITGFSIYNIIINFLKFFRKYINDVFTRIGFDTYKIIWITQATLLITPNPP